MEPHVWRHFPYKLLLSFHTPSFKAVCQTRFVHPQAVSFGCCGARQTGWQAAEVVGTRLKICLAGDWCIAITCFGFDKFRLLLFYTELVRHLPTFDVYVASAVLACRGHACMGAGLIPSLFSYWPFL